MNNFFNDICLELIGSKYKNKINDIYALLTADDKPEEFFMRHPEIVNCFRQMHETHNQPLGEVLLLELRRCFAFDVYDKASSILADWHTAEGLDTAKFVQDEIGEYFCECIEQCGQKGRERITLTKYNSRLDNYRAGLTPKELGVYILQDFGILSDDMDKLESKEPAEHRLSI